jgi:DUF438 domain-containing protein
MSRSSAYPDFARGLDADHPVIIYLEENHYLKNLLAEIAQVDWAKDFFAGVNLFRQIEQVHVRYTRKENQLFPYLEKRGWFGPSQGMWQFQDANRQLIKNVEQLLRQRDVSNLPPVLHQMIGELTRMTLVEEQRLFPIAMDLLLPEDWEEMKQGESEIGWMHKKANQQELPTPQGSLDPMTSDGFLKLSEGKMTLEQLNLVLQVMPLDLTFVDENDKVAFYNRGEERVFPRSAGVIGRDVRFCHPPKSVGTVLQILEEFKSGRKDVAEFWIHFRDRLIHIRYFAVRDAEKKYRGVIELSQDVTEIKKLEGERRLLHWEN